jgi:hypothetical protein
MATRNLIIAVDNPEWASLYQNPEDENGPHKIREGTIIEAQLFLQPNFIVHYWNKKTSKKDLAYLGISPSNYVPERRLLNLKLGSNLYFLSGIARRVARHDWANDRTKEELNTLLDCELPLVITELVGRGKPSAFVEKESDFFLGVCHLWASIAFSPTLFRSHIVSKVKKITYLEVVPPAIMLEVEPQPSEALPETRITYDFATDDFTTTSFLK